MTDRVTARSVVVPLETSADVICDSDAMAIWVGIAAQDIDDPLLDPMHARVSTHRVDQSRFPAFLGIASVGTGLSRSEHQG